MKFVTFKYEDQEHWGYIENDRVIEAEGPGLLNAICETAGRSDKMKSPTGRVLNLDQVHLLAPIPRPPSMRDGYAFRQHVETARRNRGLEMIPEFDLFPVFYFTNHHGVVGPGDVQVREAHLQRLDFELEAAVVVGKKGSDLTVG